MTNSYTFHALRDFFLGGYQAIIRNNKREVYRSPSSFLTRTEALRRARAVHRARFHVG